MNPATLRWTIRATINVKRMFPQSLRKVPFVAFGGELFRPKLLDDDPTEEALVYEEGC